MSKRLYEEESDERKKKEKNKIKKSNTHRSQFSFFLNIIIHPFCLNENLFSKGSLNSWLSQLFIIVLYLHAIIEVVKEFALSFLFV